MSTLNLVLDLLIAAILLIAVIKCFAQGLIKSIFHSLRSVAAFTVAALCNQWVAGLIADRWMAQTVYDWIYGMADSAIAGNDDLVTAVPVSLQNILAFFKINLSDIAGDAMTADNVADQFASSVGTPLAHIISSAIAFVVVFFAVWIVMFLLGGILDKVFKAPGLSLVNRIGGLFVGIISGVCWAFFAAQIIVLLGSTLTFIPIVAEQFSLENSVLLKFFYYWNPLQFLLSFS